MPKKKKKTTGRRKVTASDERSTRHMRISDDMHKSIKTQAAQQELTLNDFYDKACDWFLKHRAKRPYEMYLAPLHRGKYRSLWVDSRLLERIEVVADRDDVAVARVIFTALTLYLSEKKK